MKYRARLVDPAADAAAEEKPTETFGSNKAAIMGWARAQLQGKHFAARVDVFETKEVRLGAMTQEGFKS